MKITIERTNNWCWRIRSTDRAIANHLLSIGVATITDYIEHEIRFNPFTAAERAMFESLIPEGFEVDYV
jgi:hypothetical protein